MTPSRISRDSGKNVKSPWAVRTARAALWALGLWGLLAPMGARAERVTLDRTVLVVNDEVLTQGELDEAMASYFVMAGRKPPAPSTPEFKKVRRDVLDSIIKESLLSQEADTMGLTVNESEIDKQVSDQLEGIRKRFNTRKEYDDALAKEGITEDELKTENKRKMLRQVKAERAMASKRDDMKSETAVSDDQIRAKFKKRSSDYDQIHFSVIFFRVPEGAQKGYGTEVKKQAEDVLGQLKKGGDFEALAKKYSEDPMSAEHGGDMGEMFRSDIDAIDPALGAGLAKLGAEQLGVVEGKQGVYVARVSSKRKATFEEAMPAIRRSLQGNLQGDAMDAWIKQLKDKAYIRENL